MCTFIYFSRNGSKGIRMFSDRMVIKRYLTFESSITANTFAKLTYICCFRINGSNGIRMFFDCMIIKSLLTFESSIAVITFAELITICCFWDVLTYDEISHTS
ncbi:unnamed protein product [Callosobruchus maculatus]|uniref:Uncharacterized protein n=1 Tax=Callosobruchus maculatus TaxID=64391 RepID=A0A653D0A5_CALMS|nr:unnamed protein product [Callosobruchus maculatus]